MAASWNPLVPGDCRVSGFCCRAALLALLACVLPAHSSWAMASTLSLIEDGSRWTASVDGGGTTMAIGAFDGSLGVTAKSDGGQEDYPKIRRIWPEPQDWRRFSRLRVRLRVVCDDPAVRRKRICFVFYDEHTRLPDFRSALQRYYDLFPDFFAKRVSHEREGGWYTWGDMSKPPGALEAGFALHWGVTGADGIVNRVTGDRKSTNSMVTFWADPLVGQARCRMERPLYE